MVHYRSDGIFDAPLEKIWKYMNSDEHKHAAFKSFKLVSQSGNLATVAVEIYNPDGTTHNATITHTMNPPKGFETTISGGPLDEAKFSHSYTEMGSKTKVDLEGDFKPIPGMSESDHLKMLDNFFTTAFTEDNANLQKMK